MNLYEKFKNLEKSVNSTLPKTRWTMVRIDGRAFRTYTKHLDAPCDEKFVAAMDKTLLSLVGMEIPVVLGYVQSDEISILLDNRSLNGELNPWYGGKIQKISSVLSSAATAYFNMERVRQGFEVPAFFDARITPIRSVDEVGMYCAWRHADAVKNTISMAAHAHFPESLLKGKTSDDRLAMLREAGKPWEALPEGFRHGRFAVRESYPETVSFFHRGNNQQESKEIISKRWTLISAAEYPGMETFLPEKDIARYQKGHELGIDVDSLNEYDVSTAHMFARIEENSKDVEQSRLTPEMRVLAALSREDVDFLRGVNQPRMGKKNKK